MGATGVLWLGRIILITWSSRRARHYLFLQRVLLARYYWSRHPAVGITMPTLGWEGKKIYFYTKHSKSAISLQKQKHFPPTLTEVHFFFNKRQEFLCYIFHALGACAKCSSYVMFLLFSLPSFFSSSALFLFLLFVTSHSPSSFFLSQRLLSRVYSDYFSSDSNTISHISCFQHWPSL